GQGQVHQGVRIAAIHGLWREPSAVERYALACPSHLLTCLRGGAVADCLEGLAAAAPACWEWCAWASRSPRCSGFRLVVDQQIGRAPWDATLEMNPLGGEVGGLACPEGTQYRVARAAAGPDAC